MAIHLIRHAHAGSRSAWEGDDGDRPLSAKGRAQAEALVDLLAGEPVGQVWSSPAARCTETVELLAAAHGLEVRTDPRLAEGADAGDVLDRLLALAHEDPVVCSHGDIIPVLIRHLAAEGMRTDVGALSKKASTWRLEVEDGRVVEGRYLPPPTT